MIKVKKQNRILSDILIHLNEIIIHSLRALKLLTSVYTQFSDGNFGIRHFRT